MNSNPHSYHYEVSTNNTLFKGKKVNLSEYLKKLNKKFYVYILCRPNGEPFYVGKGLNTRVFEHELEAIRNHSIGESNPFKCNVIRKIHRDGHEVSYKIDSIFDLNDELNCLQRETSLIKKFGRLHEGGPLTNLAGGLGNISGASPYSIEKHAASLSGIPNNNPQRATLNQYLQSIGPVKSVPIKPIKQMSRILPTTPHPNARKPTARCAYALIASAAAHNLLFQDITEVPRTFNYEDVIGIIENGVARDILKAGMASLISADNPIDERFVINTKQLDIIINLVGYRHLTERGLM